MTSARLPTLRAATPAAALTREALATIPAEAFARWLVARRWFGAKGGAPTRVEIGRVVPLPWEDGVWAVAELVTDGALGRARWQLPLAVSDGADPIARVESAAGHGSLVDATTDPAFLRHLVDAFGQATADPERHGASVSAGGVTWSADTLGREAFVVPLGTPVRLASGEQSNTSILIGELAILKLFRRLEAGEHPDVEVTRFLTTEAAFAHTPTLLGTISITTPGEPPTVMGMLQEYLPKSVDAWRWTLEVERRANTPEQSPAPGPARGRVAARPSPLDAPYAPHADRLGVVTRAMHEAFAGEAARANPAFAPVPADAAEVGRWAERVKAQVVEAVALLEGGAASLSDVLREAARRVVADRGRWLARVDAIAGAVARDAGMLVRHHGDYHLGQVLRTAGGDFMVIDFEGEPSRPLADRRRKQSALRDVAGMLRSFAYAAATLAETGAEPDPSRSETAARWEQEARDAFLAGYLRGSAVGPGSGDESGFLPREPDDVTNVLTLFEIEKVFYELAYELNNRPDWAWIPLDGIARMGAR